MISLNWHSRSAQRKMCMFKDCFASQNLLRLWRKTRFARLSPPADSRAFGAQYSRFALMAYFSQTVLNRFCFAKPLAPSAKDSLRRLSPPADSRVFGARYPRFALVACFSQTVLNRVFDKDYKNRGGEYSGTKIDQIAIHSFILDRCENVDLIAVGCHVIQNNTVHYSYCPLL